MTRGVILLCVGDERLERILACVASVVATGLLGAGVYSVFYSKNGSGTVALLTIGGLGLFAIVFGDRIRSMQFGGARIQLALKVKDYLKKSFRLRLSGNYEEAETEIEFAFDEFVRQESHKVRREYEESRNYQQQVLDWLRDYVEREFKGKVQEVSSTVSFLPLIDAVMAVNGNVFKAKLESLGEHLCEYLEERVRSQTYLRAAVIVRPGPDLDVAKLVERLEQEVRNGALGIDCFVLIQNCKKSGSRTQFCDLIYSKDMHAKSLTWQPVTGPKKLEGTFLDAISTICNPSRCHSDKPANVTRLDSASEIPATMG